MQHLKHQNDCIFSLCVFKKFQAQMIIVKVTENYKMQFISDKFNEMTERTNFKIFWGFGNCMSASFNS